MFLSCLGWLWIADASLCIGRDATAPGRFSPWGSIGVRERLGGNGALAEAAFAGTTTAFGASGVVRGKTVLHRQGRALLRAGADDIDLCGL